MQQEACNTVESRTVADVRSQVRDNTKDFNCNCFALFIQVVSVDEFSVNKLRKIQL